MKVQAHLKETFDCPVTDMTKNIDWRLSTYAEHHFQMMAYLQGGKVPESFVQYSATELQVKLGELRADLRDVEEKKFVELTDAVAALQTQVEETKKWVQEVEARVGEVDDRVTTLENHVTEVDDRVATLENHVTILKLNETKAQARLALLEEAVFKKSSHPALTDLTNVPTAEIQDDIKELEGDDWHYLSGEYYNDENATANTSKPNDPAPFAAAFKPDHPSVAELKGIFDEAEPKENVDKAINAAPLNSGNNHEDVIAVEPKENVDDNWLQQNEEPGSESDIEATRGTDPTPLCQNARGASQVGPRKSVRINELANHTRILTDTQDWDTQDCPHISHLVELWFGGLAPVALGLMPEASSSRVGILFDYRPEKYKRNMNIHRGKVVSFGDQSIVALGGLGTLRTLYGVHVAHGSPIFPTLILVDWHGDVHGFRAIALDLRHSQRLVESSRTSFIVPPDMFFRFHASCGCLIGNALGGPRSELCHGTLALVNEINEEGTRSKKEFVALFLGPSNIEPYE